LKMRYRHKAQSENPNRQEHPERKGIRRKRTENVFKQREYKGVDCSHLAQDEQSVLLTWWYNTKVFRDVSLCWPVLRNVRAFHVQPWTAWLRRSRHCNSSKCLYLPVYMA